MKFAQIFCRSAPLPFLRQYLFVDPSQSRAFETTLSTPSFLPAREVPSPRSFRWRLNLLCSPSRCERGDRPPACLFSQQASGLRSLGYPCLHSLLSFHRIPWSVPPFRAHHFLSSCGFGRALTRPAFAMRPFVRPLKSYASVFQTLALAGSFTAFPPAFGFRQSGHLVPVLLPP